MATSSVLLLLASALVFSAVIASEAEPKSSQNGQSTAAAVPAEEDSMQEAFAPEDSLMEEIEKAMAPSPDDDKDYDPMELVAEMMKTDIELAKARPDLFPATAPEIARAEILANDPDELARQIMNDVPEAMAPGATWAIACRLGRRGCR